MTALPAAPTLTAWLDHQAAKYPERIAMMGREGRLTYRELAARVAAVTSGLAGAGIGRGDVVAVQLPNTSAFVVALLAVAARGGVTQTVHMPYRRAELSELLGHSGAKAAVAMAHGKATSPAGEIEALRGDLPKLETVFSVGEGGSFDGLYATDATLSDRAPTMPDDRYLLLYTSGTTSSPKGVPHAYRGFLNNAVAGAQAFGIGPGDVVCSLAAFTHLYGLMSVHMALATGATLALLPASSPAALADDLAFLKPTHLFAAPAHLAALPQDPALASAVRPLRLACLSGATVPPALATAVDEAMPDGAVIQLWGMSELQAGAYGRPDDPLSRRVATTGRASAGTSLRVVDGAGAPLPAGEDGSLEVKGPSVFAGYLNNAAETAAAFGDGGWFRTGDTATLDADGYLIITGRVKELINRGGVKFSPVDIEILLLGHPAIANCAIVPMRDAVLGERACLCVELADGAELDLATVTGLLDEAGIAKFKWPERLEVFEALPLTPTRKVMRGRLREMVDERP